MDGKLFLEEHSESVDFKERFGNTVEARTDTQTELFSKIPNFWA